MWKHGALLTVLAAAWTCCSAPDQAFVSDPAGAESLARWPAITHRTPFDALSPEEFALASPELLQVVILRRSGWSPNSYEVSPVRVFYGDRTDTKRYELFSQDATLEEGRRPVVIAFRTAKGALALQPTVSSVGYGTESSLIFRLPSGMTFGYPLRSGSSLFECIASRRLDPMKCRAERLGAFGVDDRARFDVYVRLAREDPAAAALWMLLRKRDPSARFPARACSSRASHDCASYRHFAERLNYHPSR